MRRISLRYSILIVVVAQALVLCVIAVVFFRSLSRDYSRLVFAQSAEILDLYTQMAEVRIAEAEKLSYDVLANNEIQESIREYYYAADEYGGYAARQTLYSQLFSFTFSNPYLAAVSFVYNDDSRVHINFDNPFSQRESFRQTALERARAAKGAPVWLVDPRSPRTVVCAKLIRDTTGAGGFQDLGVLLLHLQAGPLFAHQAAAAPGYRFSLVPYLDGVILAEDAIVTDGEIRELVAGERQLGTVRIGGERYLYLTRELAGTGWRFVNILSSDELLHSVALAQQLYLLSWVLVVVLVVLILFRFAGRISRPLDRLVHFMDRVRQGEYARMEKESGADPLAIREVDALTDSYNAMAQRMDYLINQVYERQLLLSEMRYQSLTYQINPHFLYNTLETIHWRAVGVGNGDISTMVLSLSGLLRASIGKGDVITVEEDLELVRDYIAIQQIRFAQRLVFTEEVAEAVMGCKIPKMTLLPLVENSIRHRLERYAGVCEIQVTSRPGNGEDGGSFSLVVRDNGGRVTAAHMEEVLRGEAQPRGSGLGLKNIHQRVQICFGEGYGLRFHSEPGRSTAVEVALPWETGGGEEENTGENTADRG